jgi:hypothetical protein
LQHCLIEVSFLGEQGGWHLSTQSRQDSKRLHGMSYIFGFWRSLELGTYGSSLSNPADIHVMRGGLG